MPSVVIPAHNEEALIERTLRGVLGDGVPDLEIVVVVNASTDRTADVARSVDPAITVVETSTPGKCHALNLGESKLDSFPRMFLDADIELHPGSLRRLFDAVSEARPIVSPRPIFDLARVSSGVRVFYRALRFNNYFGHGSPNGSGCFVVSASGRDRWRDFPDLIADDGFVQGHFTPSERSTVTDAEAVVQIPRTLESLLTVHCRIRRGNFELQSRFPDLTKNHVPRGGSVFKKLIIRPWAWHAMLVYGYIKISTRILARRQIAAGETGWGRDETGRVTD